MFSLNKKLFLSVVLFVLYGIGIWLVMSQSPCLEGSSICRGYERSSTSWFLLFLPIITSLIAALYIRKFSKIDFILFPAMVWSIVPTFATLRELGARLIAAESTDAWWPTFSAMIGLPFVVGIGILFLLPILIATLRYAEGSKKRYKAFLIGAIIVAGTLTAFNDFWGVFATYTPNAEEIQRSQEKAEADELRAQSRAAQQQRLDAQKALRLQQTTTQ